MFLSVALLFAASQSSCKPDAANARQIVEEFYVKALVEKQVRPAFERYVSADFVEHKPDIATSDREGAVNFLTGLIAGLPAANWELLRVTGDANLVAVHARFTLEKSGPAYAIADFFRVENCRIVEHWDVVAPPVKDAKNPLTRF